MRKIILIALALIFGVFLYIGVTDKNTSNPFESSYSTATLSYDEILASFAKLPKATPGATFTPTLTDVPSQSDSLIRPQDFPAMETQYWILKVGTIITCPMEQDNEVPCSGAEGGTRYVRVGARLFFRTDVGNNYVPHGGPFCFIQPECVKMDGDK